MVWTGSVSKVTLAPFGLSARVLRSQQVSMLGRIPRMRRVYLETSGFEPWFVTFQDLHKVLTTCLSFVFHRFRMIDSKDFIEGWLGLMHYYGRFWNFSQH